MGVLLLRYDAVSSQSTVGNMRTQLETWKADVDLKSQTSVTLRASAVVCRAAEGQKSGKSISSIGKH